MSTNATTRLAMHSWIGTDYVKRTEFNDNFNTIDSLMVANDRDNTINGKLTATQLISNIATGTAPLSIASTTWVQNLNVDTVDGYHLNQGVQTTDSPTFVKLTASGAIATADNSTTVATTAWVKSQMYMTTNDTISITGDASGSGSNSIPITLAASGVTAGTYTKVTVDAKGRATAGASLAATDIPNLDWTKITTGKPTTLAGYGITDAVNTSLVVTVATASKLLQLDANAKLPASITGNADGNASTATKLQTARTIAIAGDTTGSASFDGSANISITATLATLAGLTAGTYNNVTINTKGLVTAASNAAYLTGNQTVTVTGDATGSGATSIALTLANSGVTAGTYKSVTVDAKGRVTAGTNPTTLAGYGITDATSTTTYNSQINQDVRTTASPTFVKATFSQATGTAPFTITSTTKVTNLNADMVDGYSFNQSLQTTDSPTFVAVNTGRINWGGGAFTTWNSGASQVATIAGSSGWYVANNANTQQLLIVDSVGNTSIFGKIAEVQGVATAGNFGVSSVIANLSMTTISTIGPTTMLSVTPPINGNYIIWVYVRVGASTTLKLDVSFVDDMGVTQTNEIVNSAQQVGNWSAIPVYVFALSTGPISITTTVGATNCIAMSASIIGL